MYLSIFSSSVKPSSVGHVYQLINEGILDAEKLGSITIIKRSDAEKVKIYGKAGRPSEKEKAA